MQRLALLLVFLVGFAIFGRASTADDAGTDTAEPLAVTQMPRDCVALIRVAPRRLLESYLIPRIVQEDLLQTSPVSIDELEQALFWIVLNTGVDGRPAPASPDSFFSLTFTEPTDVADVYDALSFAGELRAIDERTIICAEPGRLDELASDSDSRNPLGNDIQADQLDADIYIAFQLVSDNYSVDWTGSEEMMFAMGDLGISLMDATQVHFALRSSESPLLKFWIEFSDEEIAEGYAGLLKEQLPPLIASQTENEIIGELMQALTDAWSVEQSGRVVSIELEHSEPLATELAALIDAAVQPAVMVNPEVTPRTRATNNLKNVLLASHNYHEIYESFPVHDETDYLDEDGRPFLSWRVHLLALLDEEEQALYNEFHLDEPWDSEHNIELLERMPAIYADPFGEVEDATLTRVVRFDVAADWAPFPSGVGGPIEDFAHDGLSNTIYCIVAGADKAVPWTKPEDLTIDLEQPVVPQLGKFSGESIIVGLADGAVLRVPVTVDDEVFLNLLNPTDGNGIPDVLD